MGKDEKKPRKETPYPHGETAKSDRFRPALMRSRRFPIRKMRKTMGKSQIPKGKRCFPMGKMILPEEKR